MATSKALQKPVILGINGSTIRIAHPNISGYANTQLAATISAAGTAMTVSDNNGFSDNDWFIVGNIGDAKTEECDVNGAVTRGTSLTVTNTLKFDHEIDMPVNRIQERAITIYGAATDGGTGTIIESIDAISSPIANGQSIKWNMPYTEYTLLSTDTAYAYYYVVFTDGTTTSSASDYIPSSGWGDDRVIKLIEHALDETDTKLDQNITLEMCVKWANECQKTIAQFKYQDPQTGSLKHVDWDFEVVEDTSLTASTNEIEYSFSSMTNTPKYVDSDRAIISVRLGDKKAFTKYTIDEFDAEMVEKPNTDVATQANSGDTTLVVDSLVEFDTSGTIYVGSDEVTYTGVTGTTTFTGIPASGTGSITATHAVDSAVWQNVSPDLPTKYTIWNGKILLNKPIKSDYNNFPLKVRMYKKLTDLTEASDQTPVSFYNVFHMYIGSRIERRKGNEDKAMLYMQEFQGQLLNNALSNDVPNLDAQDYYNFVYDDNIGKEVFTNNSSTT